MIRPEVIRRSPLPPDLRKEAKKELRALAATRADEIGRARYTERNAIAKAKGDRQAAEAAAERAYAASRGTILSAFEAKAAERTVREALA